jgi:hypothetical protein
LAAKNAGRTVSPAGIGAEPGQFARVLAKRDERHVDRVGGGLVTGCQQLQGKLDEFGFRQLAVSVPGVDKHADQVIRGLRALAGDERGHIGGHLRECLAYLVRRPAPVGEYGV